MKKLYLKLSLAALLAFTLQSCLLDRDKTDFGKGPIVTQFPNASASQNFLQDENNLVYDYNIPIQYFGGNNEKPLDHDVTVTVEVDPTSEAKEGVEFTIPNKEVVIPAGSNEANLLVKVDSEKLDSQNPKKMILRIVSSSEAASSNKNKIAVVLQAICPSHLAGNYVYLAGTKAPVTLTETGPGTYEVSRDDAFGSAYPFNISDVCGNLTVTGGFLPDNFGIPVSGDGTVNDETGSITINYTVDGYFENRAMVMNPTD